MPSASPSSSAQAARKALADRLQGLRKDAGLTGRELSARCGWHPAKTTRLQAAKAAPSDADIRAWCAACGVGDQAEDLIAASRVADNMYVEWRRLKRTGLRTLQESYAALYEETGTFRFYTSDVVPGVLQTADYVRAVMSRSASASRTADDMESAVAAKMDRARVIHNGDHRFVFLMEESVLRYRLRDAGTMAGQLRHLLTVLPLPRVSLGIIPFTAERDMWPVESFRVFDDRRVQVELVSASVNVTAEAEIAEYISAFRALQGLAVYGIHAQRLIRNALDTLG
jgi:transcriptional regulator with XRE-family HTH domain